MTALAAHSPSATTPRPGPSTRRDPRPAMRPPEDFCIARGYRQQSAALTRDDAATDEGAPEYWNPQRIAAAIKYQHHVYAWAAALIRRHGLRRIVDVGCGPGLKLARLVAPACPPDAVIEGLDQASAVAAARVVAGNDPRIRYRIVDLERPDDLAVDQPFDLVICADVLEHLIDPDHAMRLIARLCGPRGRVLLSTPDRARLHGRDCMESTKPEHIREWAAPEFEQYIRTRGFRIADVRFFPADQAPLADGRAAELRWRAHLADRSPHRCHTVLAHPSLA